MEENKLKLRLDETLETFTDWLNSDEAVRYRPVICMKHLCDGAYDDTGIAEVVLLDVNNEPLSLDMLRPGQRMYPLTGTWRYRQGLTQYSRVISCGWGAIYYDIFVQKNGVIVTLHWDNELAGAVWELLEKIAWQWPETREDITAWQSTENGLAARYASQWEAWWQSPAVKEIRQAAYTAIMAKMAATWELLPAEERQAHEDALKAWERLDYRPEAEKTVSPPEAEETVSPSAAVGEEQTEFHMHTLPKAAMVRRVITLLKMSKTAACRMVGIKLSTYNKTLDRKYQAAIQTEITHLVEHGFDAYLSGVKAKRGNITDLYDAFWGRLK